MTRVERKALANDSSAASEQVSSKRPRKMSVTKRVHRLDELLNKSIAYSTFLESKMSVDGGHPHLFADDVNLGHPGRVPRRVQVYAHAGPFA